MLKQRKIVAVVDDDPGFRIGTVNLLDAHGYSTRGYASAQDFLDRDGAIQFDCLLLDVRLGGMSGLELQRQLKVSGSVLPVIFMTALNEDIVRERALKTGCVAYLLKPFLPRQLLDAIEKAVPC